MRKYRGGYANAGARVPAAGDRVTIGDNAQTYTVTAYEPGYQNVTLSNGNVYHNSTLNLVLGNGYAAPDLSHSEMPQPPFFGNIPPVENHGEEHVIDGPPYDDEESYARSENSRETTGLVDSGTTEPNSRRESNASTISQNASTISQNIQDQTDSEYESDDDDRVTFNGPAGGKRRKSKRKTKRKLRWDNKATIAVVATTMAFDKTSAPPTDLPDPSGGKKSKRRKSKARKKPRSLKKRIR